MKIGLLVTILLSPLILSGQPPAGGHWQLAFSDDFSGSSVDTTKWNFRTGPRLWSDQRASNVLVKEGMLHIALKKEKAGDLDYTAGGLISKQAFRYGYYEARMRMPKGRGWHTSFWTMRSGEPTGLDDRFQEIDICEQDSTDHAGYSVNWHNYKPHSSFGFKRITGPDLSSDFHTYGAEFTAREVHFYFDGKLIHTIDVSALPHHDQHIWLTSIASYLGKTQSVEDAALPEEALVDWVRFYRRDDEPAPTTVTPDFAAMTQPVPESAKLIDPDYYIWCGTMVRGDDGKYHLYYSRWPRKLGHNAWVTHSEIAHAVGDTPTGPFHHVGVALPARGKQYWDGLCTHNPTILRAGDKYYLYYMGNTGDGIAMHDLNWTHRNNQRIGVAVADNPAGPWQRFDQPLIDSSTDPAASDALLTSNPTVARRPDGGYLMIYKAVGKQRPMPFGGPVIHLTATSDSPTGPFTKQMRPIFIAPGVDFAAEDPFAWYDYSSQRYLAIVKDNKGDFTHAGKSLALWESTDGFTWKLSDHPLVATPAVTWADGHQQKLNSLERPQLVFGADGRPIVLLCAVDEDPSRPHSFNLRIPLKLQ